jgi:hypothetical protein
MQWLWIAISNTAQCFNWIFEWSTMRKTSLYSFMFWCISCPSFQVLDIFYASVSLKYWKNIPSLSLTVSKEFGPYIQLDYELKNTYTSKIDSNYIKTNNFIDSTELNSTKLNEKLNYSKISKYSFIFI